MSIAVVLCEVASDPASGSDKQKAPMTSPLANGVKYFIFCSSEPYFSNPAHTNELFTDMITAAEASTFAISSMANTYDKLSNPAPPYCGSTIIPINPSSPIILTCSVGNFECSSLSITPGNNSV